MKRDLIKVFAVLFLVIVLVNNVCYADLIDPDMPYRPSRPSRPSDPIIIDDPIPDPVIKISWWQQLLGDLRYIAIGAVVLLSVFGAVMALANNEEKEIEAAKGREEVKEEVKEEKKTTKKRASTKKVEKEESNDNLKEESKENPQDTENTEEK